MRGMDAIIKLYSVEKRVHETALDLNYTYIMRDSLELRCCALVVVTEEDTKFY